MQKAKAERKRIGRLQLKKILNVQVSDTTGDTQRSGACCTLLFLNAHISFCISNALFYFLHIAGIMFLHSNGFR
jgi:hypothetical protein